MEKRIIEVNGMKLEVDLTTARRIDTFKVGDNVKILRKKDSYRDEKIFSGMITSFDNFKESPAITVAYIEKDYNSSPNIKFVYITKDTDNYEIILASPDEIHLTEDGIVEGFEREIRKKENEASELREKLDYFKKYFMNIEPFKGEE